MNYNKSLLDAVLRNDFVSFIHKVFNTINPGTKYVDNWHIKLIVEYLNAVHSGQIKRLIINMPPRNLKSICVSVAWPAWLLAQDPSERIIVASYSAMLSVKHSMDSRFVMSSDWYQDVFPNSRLSKKCNKKDKFLTTQNGLRLATSVGGSVIGEGGNYLIVDDPHNPSRVASKKLRNHTIEWFEQSFATRLNDKNTGAIIVVMQRLHEHDLSGYLESKNSDWEILKIPVKAESNIKYSINNFDYLYKENEFLNSKRDNTKVIDALEKEIGSKGFMAQYMQMPISENFNMVSEKDLGFYESLPEKIENYILSIDTAIKLSDNADYTAITCWAISAGIYYLVGLVRDKMSYVALKRTTLSQIRKYNPKYVIIEDKASGQSLIQDLKFEGYNNVVPTKPKIDKVTRFASAVPILQSGMCLFPKYANFKHNLLYELTNFPNTKHDDIVDSISQFINWIKDKPKTQSGFRFL